MVKKKGKSRKIQKNDRKKEKGKIDYPKKYLKDINI
jgi:hypothetical protein